MLHVWIPAIRRSRSLCAFVCYYPTLYSIHLLDSIVIWLVLSFHLPCNALPWIFIPAIDVIPSTTHLGLANRCCKAWLPAAVTDSPQIELSVDSIGSVTPTLFSPVPSAPPTPTFWEHGRSCVRLYSSDQPIGPQPSTIPQNMQLPTRFC